jgi:medium-chain acyl-[acyl-carrier-protein] hydrolase
VSERLSTAEFRLYCLPPAGAGAAVFRTWQSRLPGGVKVCPIQLPGRETRLHEEPITGMDALSAQIAPILDTTAPGGCAVLGHSFGALAAFEAVRRLRATSDTLPDMLVVLAAPAPQLPVAALEDEDEVAFLRRVGGIAADVINHPGFMRLIMPALRADVRICCEYLYADESPLDIPIVAMAGTRDPLVPVGAVAEWAAQTTAGFRFEILEDDHFFPGRGDHFFRLLADACGVPPRS